MSYENLPEDKIKERIILLKRFLPHLEWDGDWYKDIRAKIFEIAFRSRPQLNTPKYMSVYSRLQSSMPVRIEDIAECISDSQLEEMISLSPSKDYHIFRGKYYTVRRGGIFEHRGSWDEIKAAVKEVLKTYGKKGYALLKALVEVNSEPFGVIATKASEIYGERIYPSQLIAELRDRWDLAWEVGSRQYPKWAMPEEIKPAVIEVLSEFEITPIPPLRTIDAEQEFLMIIKMEEEFKNYLTNS